jgi:hypothetical protein
VDGARARAIAWKVIAGAVLLMAALEARLPEMTRPVWQDEIHHNEPIVDAATLAELDQSAMYRSMMQPKLDFASRKLFWFPVFGISERTIRLPALCFNLALVLLVYVVLLLQLRSSIAPPWHVVVAFCASLWIANNPMQVLYATEGRHYSMVAFASTAWLAMLLLFDGKPRWLLAASALLLANSHFFALPLLAAGYGLQIFRELRARKPLWILFHVATCFCIYKSIVSFSSVAFTQLMTQPPNARQAQPFALLAMFDWPTIKRGLDVWWRFSQVLAVPPATWIAWLLMLGDVCIARRWRWLPSALAAFVLFPALFVYAEYRSSYPWADRYFSAFFGFGLVSLVAAIDIGLRLWRHVAPRLPQRARRLAAAASVAAVLLVARVPSALYGLVAGLRQLHGIPANFSPYYRAYREIWEERKPVMVLHHWLYTTDFQRFYFRYVLPPNGITYRMFDVLGYDIDSGVLKTGIPWFLTAFAKDGAFIVLDEKEKDCANRPDPEVPAPMRVERVRAITACIWKVRGATTLAEVALAANQVGFGAANRLH